MALHNRASRGQVLAAKGRQVPQAEATSQAAPWMRLPTAAPDGRAGLFELGRASAYDAPARDVTDFNRPVAAFGRALVEAARPSRGTVPTSAPASP